MKEPKISANKLVEYCFASPQRRNVIIQDIIRPKNFLLDTRYNDIERAMMFFIEAAVLTIVASYNSTEHCC